MTSRTNICLFALAAGLAVACAADEGGVRSIAEVQGAGATSPLVGRVVAVEGVVTGDFQDGDADRQNNLGGFFIQSIEPDGDPDTSDGLFVYDSRTEVRVGDVVRVEGEARLRRAVRGLAEPDPLSMPGINLTVVEILHAARESVRSGEVVVLDRE